LVKFRQSSKLNRNKQKTSFLLGVYFLLGMLWSSAQPMIVRGETPVACKGVPTYLPPNVNKITQNDVAYTEARNPGTFTAPDSNAVTSVTVVYDTSLKITQTGITNAEGKPVISFGLLLDALQENLKLVELNKVDANKAALNGVRGYVSTPRDFITSELLAKVRTKLNEAVPTQAEQIKKLTDTQLILSLTGLNRTSLVALGVKEGDLDKMLKTATEKITELSPSLPFEQLSAKVYDSIRQTLPQYTGLFIQVEQTLTDEIRRLQSFQPSAVNTEGTLYFNFILTNPDPRVAAQITLPNAQTIQKNEATSNATIQSVTYQVFAPGSNTPRLAGDITQTAQQITLGTGEQVRLVIGLKATKTNDTNINIGFFTDGCNGNQAQQSLTIFATGLLIDPNGRVTGCAGEILADYRGFSIGVYDPVPSSATGEIANITPLTVSELPDDPNNNIPAGVRPNIENSNPFFLTNSDQGRYAFLLDAKRGQLDQGREYILVIKPSADSVYNERRIKLVMGDRFDRILEYTAISLDGRPVNATDGRTSVKGTLVIDDAERVGLDLAILDLDTNVCEAQEIQIIKSGDRATAKPGDIVLYRLLIRALAQPNIVNIVVTDLLPLGINFKDGSTRAELGGKPINVTTTRNGNNVTFTLPVQMKQGESLNIIYAAEVTPDALRGTGQNDANVQGVRADNNYPVRDGPAVHVLGIRPGIITDAGTIIGRVFVDKNFDGQQQSDEPGVPNAVLFLQDGNRVTTDADGLFSVKNVLPGYYTGILDLETLPGYTLAPNLYFSEGNSQSRLVHLSPGGMVRMNFGVTPIFSEQ
jgi:uncharacterized repeat protein (TIGR01451 family)